MIVYTASEIATRFNVTQEQIDLANRILDCQTGKVFYQVESQTTAGVVYEVRYFSQFKRMGCNCAAAQRGIPCWHKRAASAAAFEYRQNENVQARQEAKEAEEAALQTRVRTASDAHYAELVRLREEARNCVAGLKAGKGVQQARPFSLLK